jgi:hypothetical protein
MSLYVLRAKIFSTMESTDANVPGMQNRVPTHKTPFLVLNQRHSQKFARTPFALHKNGELTGTKMIKVRQSNRLCDMNKR